MKKIYTLIAATAMVFSASAQNDWAANLITPTSGSTSTSDPLMIDFEAENMSDNTYSAGDTLWFSLGIEGSIVGLDLAAGGVNGYILADDIAPGGTFTVPTVGIDWVGVDAETSYEICVVVYGIGIASFSGDGETIEDIIVGDDDTSNNLDCFTAELPVHTGVEELGLSLSQVYTSGDELVIVNEGTNGSEMANVSIINMNGQTVQTENLVMAQGTSSVAINDLAPGIYVVAIEVDGIVESKKVAIQ